MNESINQPIDESIDAARAMRWSSAGIESAVEAEMHATGYALMKQTSCTLFGRQVSLIDGSCVTDTNRTTSALEKERKKE